MSTNHIAAILVQTNSTGPEVLLGRGSWGSISPVEDVQALHHAEVEWAYIGMPTSVLVDLQMDPLELVCKKDLFVAARYVVEHRLEVQNVEHGVAPSSYLTV